MDPPGKFRVPNCQYYYPTVYRVQVKNRIALEFGSVGDTMFVKLENVAEI